MSFTMFDKFGDAAACLPDEQRRELYVAICEYGFVGEMPEGMSPVVVALMAVMRDDIDNSKASRSQGRLGGRPRHKTETTPSDVSQRGGSEKTETHPLQDSETPHMKKTETGGSEKTETQTKPSQANTSQAKKSEKRAKARFSPPTTDEVAKHVREKGYCFDPEAFTAYYESVGWRVGDKPMKSWQAACVTWERRERAEKGGGHVSGDVYSRL